MDLANKNTSAVEIYNTVGEKLQKYYRDISPMDWYINSTIQQQDQLSQEILILLNKLNLYSFNDNFYWLDCPLTVFQSTIDERLKEKRIKFLNPELSKDKMLLSEYEQLNKIASVFGYKHYSDIHRYLGAVKRDLNDYRSLGYQHILDLDLSTKEKFEDARLKKINFIEEYFKKKDQLIVFRDGKYRLELIPKNSLEHNIDLSDTKDTEKIIYLHELGILDLLKRSGFNYSTNSLAVIVSAFTGIKRETAQSYLNPINNPDVKSTKNNPLSKEKNVQKVKQKLKELGFKPLK